MARTGQQPTVKPARGVWSLALFRRGSRLGPRGHPVPNHWHGRHGVSQRPGLSISGVDTDAYPEGVVVRSDEHVGHEVQRILAPLPLSMLVPLRAYSINELVLVLEVLEPSQAFHDVLEVGVEDDFFVHVDEGGSSGVEDVEPVKRRQQLVIFVNDLRFRFLFVFSRVRLCFRWGPTK